MAARAFHDVPAWGGNGVDQRHADGQPPTPPHDSSRSPRCAPCDRHSGWGFELRGQAGVGVTGGGVAYNPLPATLPSALPCAVPLSEQQALTVPLPPSVLYCWARRPPNDDAPNDNGPALPPFRSLRFLLTFPCCATSLFVWPLPHAAKASAAAPSPASPPPVSPPPAPANGVRVGWGAYSGGGGRDTVATPSSLPPATYPWLDTSTGRRAGGRAAARGRGGPRRGANACVARAACAAGAPGSFHQSKLPPRFKK